MEDIVKGFHSLKSLTLGCSSYIIKALPQLAYLESVQDGEYPSEESGLLVDTEEPKNPRQTQERKQDNGSYEKLPIKILSGINTEGASK